MEGRPPFYNAPPALYPPGILRYPPQMSYGAYVNPYHRNSANMQPIGYGYTPIPMRDPWLMQFEQKYKNHNEKLDKQKVVMLLDEMKTIIQDLEEIQQTTNPTTEIISEKNRKESAYNELLSKFLMNGSSLENPIFTPSFREFQKRIAKQHRKYRWRKKKRGEWRAKKPIVEEKKRKLTQVVDSWFEEKTKELHEQKKAAKKKKEALLAKRKERKQKKAMRKQLSYLLAIFYEKTKHEPSRFQGFLRQLHEKSDNSSRGQSDNESTMNEKDEFSITHNLEEEVTSNIEDNEEMSENRFYTLPQNDIDALVRVRNQWDCFLVPHGHPNGSRIPQQMVTPSWPPSADWKPFIKVTLTNKKCK